MTRDAHKSQMTPDPGHPTSVPHEKRLALRAPKTGRFLCVEAGRPDTTATIDQRDASPLAGKELSWSEAADRVLDQHLDFFIKLADR
jgi:hypothetical protein